MPKKYPNLEYEFVVEDLDTIPQELDDLIDAIDLALSGKGEALAEMILTSNALNLMPKEVIAELFRNTKKSPRPNVYTITELKVKNSESNVRVTRRLVSNNSLKSKKKSIGRPKNKDNTQRNEGIFNEYKTLIKTLPKWQSLQNLSAKYHLSEPSIEEILKEESALERHGMVVTRNGGFRAKKWFFYGREKQSMGDKSE